MTVLRAVVRPKGQVTLPPAVRRQLHLVEGDDVAFDLVDDGTVRLRGLKSVPADQVWFWQDSWQSGECEATAEIAAGGLSTFDSADDFVASLD